MSNINEIVARISNVTQFDSSGNITGVAVSSVVPSTNSNVGALTVGNLLATSQSGSFGLGNANVGGDLTAGSQAFIAGNLNATKNITGNANAFILGNAVFGNSNVSSNTTYKLYSNVVTNFSSTGGAFTILSPVLVDFGGGLIASQIPVGTSTSITATDVITGGNVNIFGNSIIAVNGNSANTPGRASTGLMYLGSNTAVNPVITLNSSNVSNSGLLLNNRGVFDWKIGIDSSNNFSVNGYTSQNNFSVTNGTGRVVLDATSGDVSLSSNDGGNISYNAGSSFHNFDGVTIGTRPTLIYDGWYSTNVQISSFSETSITLPGSGSPSYNSCTLAEMGLTGFTTSLWKNTSGSTALFYVTASIPLTGSSTGIRRLTIYRFANSSYPSILHGCTEVSADTSGDITLSTSGLVQLANNDEVAVFIYQTSLVANVYIPSGSRNPISISLTRM